MTSLALLAQTFHGRDRGTAFGSILATREAGTTGAAHAAAFVSGLDELLLIAASIALAAGTLALLLIRQSDFATAAHEPVLEASAA